MKSSAPRPRRSPCPVACALDLIGDRWTLLVVRDLFLGKTRYDQFLQSPEGIATNILADRLNLLVDAGLARKLPDPEDKRRFSYELTEKGLSLKPVLTAVLEWGQKHLPGTRIPAEVSAKRAK